MSYDSSWLTMKRMQRILYAHKMQQLRAMRAGQRSTMQLEGGNNIGAMTYTPHFYYTNTGALETTITEDVIYSGRAAPVAEPEPEVRESIPSVPTITSITHGDRSVTIYFTTTGSASTVYTVKAMPGSITVSGSSSPLTIPGLTQGAVYTFTVSAANTAGSSGDSVNSDPVTAIAVAGAPTGASAAAGNGSATVSFTAPASNGGATITGYTVTSSPGGFTGTGSSSPIVVSGLSNGTAYTFTVVATNEAGNSVASSASSSVTARTVPDAPTGVTATANADGTITVTYTAPDNGGSAILDYTVTPSPSGTAQTVSGTTATFSGLGAGTIYTFTVVARNAAGNSVASSASNGVTLLTAPDPPTNLIATRGNLSATISFTAPVNNGGSPITSYRMTRTPNGTTTVTSSTSPITFTGLTKGTTYSFSVVAINAVGASVASSSVSIVAATTPSAPTITTPLSNLLSTSVTVPFTAPTDNGGATITNYEYKLMNASYSTILAFTALNPADAISPITITGMQPSTEYLIQIRAVNEIGSGAVSNIIGPFTTLSTPPIPTLVSIMPGDSVLYAYFTTPSSSATITNFEYSLDNGVTFTACSPTDTISPITITTGITNNTSYQVALRLIANTGTSVASNVITIAPKSITSLPTPSIHFDPSISGPISGNAITNLGSVGGIGSILYGNYASDVANGYINMSSGTTLNPGYINISQQLSLPNKFAVIAWIKSFDYVVSILNPVITLFKINNANFRFSIQSTHATLLSQTTTIANYSFVNNTWYHVSFIIDDNNIGHIFINGIPYIRFAVVIDGSNTVEQIRLMENCNCYLASFKLFTNITLNTDINASSIYQDYMNTKSRFGL